MTTPTKAWAIVNKENGKIDGDQFGTLEIFYNRKDAKTWSYLGTEVLPVEIRIMKKV